MSTPGRVAEYCAKMLGRPVLPVGSGTWAIACLLYALGEQRPRRRLALPSFLCHNPLSAALYAGWHPVFCDINPVTGTPTIDDWRKALDSGVDAVLLVHLFGNPECPWELEEECRVRGVFLIEDACQALGSSKDGHLCGSFGDAAVLSFGHTKQVDAGGGAMLASEDNHLLERVASLAEQISLDKVASRPARASAYGERFYIAKERMANAGPIALAGLAEAYVGLVPHLWKGDSSAALAGLKALETRSLERRRKADLYQHLLSDTGLIEIGGRETASPWRFCFRVPGIDRTKQAIIAQRVREQGVHVSNWYLPLPWLLDKVQREQAATPGAILLSSEIFQLWLDEGTSDEQVYYAAAVVRSALI